ncbi:MAG TPA: tetratricopeptide repeat protein [Terriglobia bacterium]|nr:tetratricopeptide repeat protein [Terriglobia bacterium]
MKPRILLQPATVTLGLIVALGLSFQAAGQEPKETLTQPDLSSSSLSQETKSSASEPKREVSLEDRADIFMARKSYADAVDYYQRAMREGRGSDPSLWNKVGIAYQQQLNYKAARNAYKKAIKLNKVFAEAWNNLGTTYFLQNKAKKSIKYYRQAIKLNPSGASFHVNLGTSLYKRKKIPEALEEYRTALALDPNVLTDRSSVGTVLQAQGADPKFYFYLAKVFASLGRPAEAVRYLRRAFEDGFSNQKQLDEDPDFQKISEYPAYVELRNNPPVPIKD